jgi:molybdopterin molybdotransferase
MSGMRPLEKLVSLEEALRAIDKASRPTDRTEEVPIWSASGRVLAEDIRAGIEVPSFTRSAMDGYAVRCADVKSASAGSPAMLKVIGKIFAGSVAKKPVKPGQCSEIATGGMLPEGADAVVKVEDTSDKTKGSVSVFSPASKGENIISAGSDIAKGARIVGKGDLLSPAKVGSIAAIGVDSVKCYGRPSVVVMPTGDEVVRPGEKLKPGQVYDVNTFTLKSAAMSFGAEVDVREIVGDSKESLMDAIGSEAADMIIFSGGSSVGEKDLIVDAVSELGKVIFHGVSIRPGKPTLLGKVGSSLILGMPGHPTSCLSNAYIFLEPMINKIGRYPISRRATVSAKLSADAHLAEGRSTVLPVRLDGGKAVPVFKESSAITSMSNADGYAIVPPSGRLLKKGTAVTVTLF